MDKLRDLISHNKKPLTNLAVGLCVGIGILLFAKTFETDGTQNSTFQETQKSEPTQEVVEQQDYERVLEKKLEGILTQVQGAGNVEVMLTLSYGGEIVVAEDTVTNELRTSETDAQGGRREQHDTSYQGTKIMFTGKDGSQQPLILREYMPKVEGVLIVAEGGDDIFVKDGMIKAAQTVLGVEPHKVQVLKMK